MRNSISSTVIKPAGCAGRFFGAIFFGIFFAAGLIFTILLACEFWPALAAQSWTATPCRILSTTVEPAENSRYVVAVRYQYDFNGAAHTSDRLQPGKPRGLDSSDAQVLATRYEPGTQATCYVNARDPGAAVLERNFPTILFFIFIPLIFVAVGLAGMIGSLARSPQDTSISSQAKPVKPSRAAGIGCFGFVILIGLVAGHFLLFKPIGGILAARHWAEVPCVVESSSVRSHSDSDGTTYSVDILYRYDINERTYRSNRYGFIGGSSSGYDGKQKIVAKYPPGSQRVCYVNPDNPAEAILNRGFQPIYFLGLIPLTILVIGILGLLNSFRARYAPGYQPAVSPAGTGTVSRDLSGGPATLKSGSPLGRLFVVIFIAAFWNGIVSIFVWQCYKGWAGGDGSWFLTLFLIPFLLVGALFIFGIGYTFLAMFNPRATLKIETDRIPLGGRAWLEWSIVGDVRKIKKLTLWLEGVEEATYRRGTNTHTSKSIFHQSILFETQQLHAMQFNRIDLAIPELSMHSFDAPNNKIRWSLRLHGEIERWPDVDERFPVTILPAPEIKS